MANQKEKAIQQIKLNVQLSDVDTSLDLESMRHSAEHVLTEAMIELYGADNIIFAMGPPIDDGFYFDFSFKGENVISPEDFEAIEKKMAEIIKANKPIIRSEVSYEEARKIFESNPFKLEWIDIFEERGEEDFVSIYTTGDGDFVDLCKGPHVQSTGKIGPIKLLSIAGAYWHGDEKNEMLTRIYGTSFHTKKELKEFLWRREEAKKRDHRKLGKELDLFLFSDLVGGGLPMWTPKGTLFRNLLDDYVWSLRKARGYQKVSIPHITKKDLYERSGHWKKYSDDLFKINTREGHEFAMKPMNCPHHTQIYDHIKRSYRELPERYAETTMVYRDEQSGELSGLSRVRAITQDDAHVFCRKSQLTDEMNSVWDIVDAFYGTFGFELKARISLHDPENFENYLGTPEIWAENEEHLRQTARERGVEFFEEKGEAAFYGPKIDFMAYDSLGREWQVATIQLDTNMPDNFDLTCVNEDGEDERIVMLHVAIMGSIERFSSIIIEHFVGAFPAWLSPVQVMFVPIADRHIEYSKSIISKLAKAGIRAEIDERSERMNQKIRDAQLQKIPYMLVIGDKEVEANAVSLRLRTGENIGAIAVDEFIQKVSEVVKSKKLSLWVK